MVSGLAACSLATMAYNNAGSLIGFALNDYVELNEQQEAIVKERVNQLIAWHRKSELPQLLRLLNEARERGVTSPAVADVRDFYTRGQAHFERTVEQVLPDMAELLRQLEPSQIARLEKKFAKENLKVMEDMAKPQALRQSKRLERTRERYEDLFGSLSAEQAAYLQAHQPVTGPLDAMRLADRKRWQREFTDAIKSNADTSQLLAELRILILTPEKRRDPAYQAELSRQQEEMLATTTWMLASATPAQKAKLQKKISGYAEDVTRLLRA
ncbi:MAG: DUF6279 family lipoprotein [Betaproteobacteria bacterium]